MPRRDPVLYLAPESKLKGLGFLDRHLEFPATSDLHGMEPPRPDKMVLVHQGKGKNR